MHLYVVGARGARKSKFIQHLLAQLITKGFGAGLFDPHSDLASNPMQREVPNIMSVLDTNVKQKQWKNVQDLASAVCEPFVLLQYGFLGKWGIVLKADWKLPES